VIPLVKLFFVFTLVIIAPRGGFATQNLNSSEYSNFAFGLDLYKALDIEGANTIITPNSIGSALYFLAIGSQGQTKMQILNGIGINRENIKARGSYGGLFNKDKLKDFSIYSALAFGKSVDIKDEFRKKFSGNIHFDTVSASLDNINKWTREVTQRSNNSIIDILEPGVPLVLLNVSSFPVVFKPNLDASQIKKVNGTFSVDKGQYLRSEYITFSSRLVHLQFSELEIYLLFDSSSGSTYMFLLSKAGEPLESFRNRLTLKFLSHVLEESQLIPSKEYVVSIPIFDLTSRRSFKLAIQGLGVVDVFNHEIANLSELTTSSCHISDFFASSRAFVEVSSPDVLYKEENTAQVPLTDQTGSVLSPLEIKFDRPFIFIAIDPTKKQILNISKIVNPVK